MALSQADLNLNHPFVVSENDLIGYAIYQAIVCKTWATVPRKVYLIAEKIKDKTRLKFDRVTDSFYCKTFENYDALLAWLKEEILPIKEIQELNLSQREFEAGIKVDDPKRGAYTFISAFSSAIPATDDFVGLDAYIRNLAHDLIRAQIEIHFGTFR